MSSQAPSGWSQRSFRDPAGRVFTEQGRVLRVVTADAAQPLLSFLASPVAEKMVEAGSLVATRVVEEPERRTIAEPQDSLSAGNPSILLEHPAIWFPSYPHEWPAEMLVSAGEMTLDLASAVLDAGYGLKDATPGNVLFRGPRPVFVDVLSIEPRDPDDPIWLPHAQFVRTFILPLMLNRLLGLDLRDIFLTRRDGLDPESVYPLLGPMRRLLPPWLGLISLPTWLSRRAAGRDAWLYRKRQVDPKAARFMLRHTLGRLRRALRRARPRSRASAWTAYQETCSYSAAGAAQKEAFVAAAVEHLRPKRVLDVGCNTGQFACLAARSGASVVAIDSDPAVVGAAFVAAARDRLDILPLVVDLARPTPAVGWRNQEAPSFLARAHGQFDLVLMLAVVHHLVVTERVPLPEIVDLIATVARQAVVVEYVGREDPMFVRLLRGRAELHRDWSREAFEAAWQRRFAIEASERVASGTRSLYLLRRLGS